jgi:hypothetical protein
LKIGGCFRFHARKRARDSLFRRARELTPIFVYAGKRPREVEGHPKLRLSHHLPQRLPECCFAHERGIVVELAVFASETQRDRNDFNLRANGGIEH